MILILSRPALKSAMAKVVANSTGHRAEVVHSIQSALRELEKRPFILTIIDDGFPELDDRSTKLILGQCKAAIPVFVNFVLSRPERISSLARTAIQTAQTEERAAQQISRRELEAQIRTDLTAIILAAQQKLRAQSAPGIQDHMTKVLAAALRIRTELKNIEPE